MIKRLDTLEVATSDLADAASIYEENFGFAVARRAAGRSAAVCAGREGLIGLWLEAEDVDQVIADFRAAGLEAGAIRIESGRRILTIDPKQANQVPLFIFDRKA